MIEHFLGSGSLRALSRSQRMAIADWADFLRAELGATGEIDSNEAAELAREYRRLAAG